MASVLSNELRMKILQEMETRDIQPSDLEHVLQKSNASCKRYMGELVSLGLVYYYPENRAKNPRRVYTLDKEKAHKISNALDENIIQGARVFLIDDKKRFDKQLEIMRSNYRKSPSIAIGTSFGDVALRVPFI